MSRDPSGRTKWGPALNVTFYGVRGSTPCSSDSNRRYGGNTSCVVIESDERDPILLDLGTGLRFFGLSQPRDGTFRGTALLSHLHWDHVQGIPFFSPMLAEGARLDIYGPTQHGVSLEDAVREFIQPPYFPVEIDALPGVFEFHEVERDVFDLDGAKVTVAPVPHCGPTVGYRIDCDGVSIAYVSDHQQPGPDSTEVSAEVLDLCQGVDLLIHDAQFDRGEFECRSDWGHCTVQYAVEVANRSGAKRLAMFHHDPSHGDERMDELLADAQRHAAGIGDVEVLAAAEGLTLSFGGTSQR